VNCLDEIIEMFKRETGNNDWCYFEDNNATKIVSSLKKADSFVKKGNS